jgi:hypothetical protein
MQDEFGKDEFGAATGSARENDPHLPGFTDEQDRLFRSHFQHAQRLSDQTYDDVRPAYRLGFQASSDSRYRGREFEEIEEDLQNGWLNVRVGADSWQAVRDYAREGFERGRRIGFVDPSTAASGDESAPRPSFSDPVAGGIDPTAPDSPEQTHGF